jgi:aspartate ammonia-lyase
MPGKVNPVIPEYVVSIAHQVYANDHLITDMAALGCLELNAYLPSVGNAMLQSLDLLISANQYMTYEEVRTCLINSVDQLPPSESGYNLRGRLNARAALDCAKALKTNELKKLNKCFVVHQSNQTIEIFCQDILYTEAFIFSAEGKAIKTNFTKTNNSIIFEISELSSGIYFINFPGIKSLKFFKG